MNTALLYQTVQDAADARAFSKTVDDKRFKEQLHTAIGCTITDYEWSAVSLHITLYHGVSVVVDYSAPFKSPPYYKR